MTLLVCFLPFAPFESLSNPIFLFVFNYLELQSRMTSQMNEGLTNWERDRRVNSCPDYEEKQLLALNGTFLQIIK